MAEIQRFFCDFDYQPIRGQTKFPEQVGLKINSCLYQPENFYQECLNTAQYIRDNTTGPLMVSLSGGIDSEVICRSFMALEIEFEVFTLRYSDDSNHNDIQYAIDFCNANQIKQHIHTVDFSHIYDKKMNAWIADGYLATNIFRYLQLYIIETITNLGYNPVLGSGEQRYQFQNNIIGITLRPEIVNALRFGSKTGKSVWPYFFMCKPEIVSAFLLESDVKRIIGALKSCNLLISQALKKTVYTKYFPELMNRPKYSGFELHSSERRKIQEKNIKSFGDPYVFISLTDLNARLQTQE